MKSLRPFLLWFLCAALPLAAQMSTLQNLPAVGVSVRGYAPDAAMLGLTETTMINAVRAVIEPAGVKVLPPPIVERTPEAAVLEISANVSLYGKSGFFFILDLQLREGVKTVRKLQTLTTIPAVTWAEQEAGFTAKPEKAEAALAKLAQKFADEWAKAQGR